MNEVTDKNFTEFSPVVEEALRNATFISIDAEFSGLRSDDFCKESLFDDVATRYKKLRATINPFIIIQVGLTAFKHCRETCRYEARSFNFFIRPKHIPTKNRQFLSQVAALEFLSLHGFDFNKFIYNGISYLNEVEEAELRQQLQENVLLRNTERDISYAEEEDINDIVKNVSDWLSENKTESIDLKTPTALLQYLAQKELRNRFPNVWTKSGDGTIIVTKVSKDVRQSLLIDEGDNLDQELLNSCLGFSKIFKLLVSLKKPIVGHNIFLDLLFFYQQFYRPLPSRYSAFKSDIHKLFPAVYDTKFLSYELKRLLLKNNKKLKADGLNTSSLSNLYNSFTSDKSQCTTLNSPRVTLKGRTESDKEAYHTAGWDAFCTGYVFIKMAHIFVIEKIGEGCELKQITNTELMSGVKSHVNCLNLIRGMVSYAKLDGSDPKSQRPQWLYVRMIGTTAINISYIAEMMASYGAVDVKFLAPQRALVAVANHGSARDILTHFRTHKEIRVIPYSPLKHSPGVKTCLWSSVMVSGGLLAWILLGSLLKER